MSSLNNLGFTNQSPLFFSLSKFHYHLIEFEDEGLAKEVLDQGELPFFCCNFRENHFYWCCFSSLASRGEEKLMLEV